MLSDLIDKVLSQEEEHEPSGKLSPSLLFGCDRKAIFRQRKTPPTILLDARTKRVFAMGHAVEKFVLDSLEKAEKLLGRGLAVENTCWSGVIDAIAKEIVPEGDVWDRVIGSYVLEVKSVHSKAFLWNLKES